MERLSYSLSMKKARIFLFLALCFPLLGFSWAIATAYGKTEFSYVTTGISVSRALISNPDSLFLKESGLSFTYGKRYSLAPKWAIDLHLGLAGNPIQKQIFSLSTGLLFYAAPFQGSYLGANINYIISHKNQKRWSSRFTFPLLVGYQWPSKQFLQSEWTPKGATFSYGFSF